MPADIPPWPHLAGAVGQLPALDRVCDAICHSSQQASLSNLHDILGSFRHLSINIGPL